MCKRFTGCSPLPQLSHSISPSSFHSLIPFLASSLHCPPQPLILSLFNLSHLFTPLTTSLDIVIPLISSLFHPHPHLLLLSYAVTLSPSPSTPSSHHSFIPHPSPITPLSPTPSPITPLSPTPSPITPLSPTSSPITSYDRNLRIQRKGTHSTQTQESSKLRSRGKQCSDSLSLHPISSPPHPLTSLPTHPLTSSPLILSLPHPLIPHPLTSSPPHPLILSLPHPSPPHPLTPHPLTSSPPHSPSSHFLTPSPTHPLTSSPPHPLILSLPHPENQRWLFQDADREKEHKCRSRGKQRSNISGSYCY